MNICVINDNSLEAQLHARDKISRRSKEGIRSGYVYTVVVVTPALFISITEKSHQSSKKRRET
jgi:hypothetical protein